MKDQIKKTAAAATLAVLAVLASFMPVRVSAAASVPVTVDIAVTYIVEGNADIAGGDIVTLEADDPSSPMPGGTKDGKKTITIGDEGTYSFGDIHYEKPDGHGYVLVFREGSDEKTELVYTDRVAPATGDAGQLLLYCGMTVTAAAALAVFSALRSRRKKKENA